MSCMYNYLYQNVPLLYCIVDSQLTNIVRCVARRLQCALHLLGKAKVCQLQYSTGTVIQEQKIFRLHVSTMCIGTQDIFIRSFYP